MRIIIALLAIAVAWPAQAVSCTTQLSGLVELLEKAQKEYSEVIMGDLAYPKIVGSMVKTAGDNSYFRYTVPHQNMQKQSWVAFYEVVADSQSCEVKSYSYKGHSEKISCISQHEAREKIKIYLHDKIGTVPIDDFSWLDEDAMGSRMTGQKAKKVESTMSYNGGSQKYVSETVYSRECVAAAECWGGYSVSCKGKVSSWWEGD